MTKLILSTQWPEILNPSVAGVPRYYDSAHLDLSRLDSVLTCLHCGETYLHALGCPFSDGSRVFRKQCAEDPSRSDQFMADDYVLRAMGAPNLADILKKRRTC